MENENTNKNWPENFKSAEIYIEALQEEIWAELTNLNMCWEEDYESEEEYLADKEKYKARLDELIPFFDQEKKRLGLSE